LHPAAAWRALLGGATFSIADIAAARFVFRQFRGSHAILKPRRHLHGSARMVILFNKPFGVLPQFTDRGTASPRPTLSDFIVLPGVYPAGRLDRDSEGLMVLTDDGRLQARIADPRHKLFKTYLVQVEGVPDTEALDRLRAGVTLKDGLTRPAQARLIDAPPLWPRDPPVRFRLNVPDRWLELTIHEGRNRQVRRMTAAVGHPTLRLVRWRVGPWVLDGLEPGQWRKAEIPEGFAQGHAPRLRGRAGTGAGE